MKKILLCILLICFMSSFAQASKLIDNRIQFSSFMGYIVEKFIVPKGKTCVKSISTETMDKNGGYSVAISNIEEPPAILYNRVEWYEGNSGTILLDLTKSPVNLASGMEIMLYVIYITDDLGAFSVPVRSGGTEIGHNDIHDPFSEQLPPISEPGYKAFTLEYGCESECVNTAPSFLKGSNQIAYTHKSQNISGWASDILPGSSDCEFNQNLWFEINTNNDSLFSIKPQIDVTTGNLSYKPTSDIQGVAIVTVTLKDDGDIENGGVNTSPPQTFMITVIIPGNIDGKDTITLSDAVLSLKMLAGFQPDYVCIDADVNGDRRIGMEELIFILEKLSGLK